MPDLLSPHFSYQELTRSDVALRHGIANVPDEQAMKNLKYLAQRLEIVRDFLGHPMHINSAFRCLSVNALVGSKPTSAHTRGLAADFVCPEYGAPRDIVLAITGSDIIYDQIIIEFDSWVHIAFAAEGERNRMQKLVINSYGTSALA